MEDQGRWRVFRRLGSVCVGGAKLCKNREGIRLRMTLKRILFVVVDVTFVKDYWSFSFVLILSASGESEHILKILNGTVIYCSNFVTVLSTAFDDLIIGVCLFAGLLRRESNDYESRDCVVEKVRK